MAQITWTNEALRWLEDIFEYIAEDNPDAANRTVEGIFERAQVLAQYPEMGHRSSRLGDQWRVIYRVVSDETLFQVASITAHDYRRP
jgi:addiction module RelE/StbE family toxin